ncbi:MAG TPA: radical SAM protein [Anaerolineae bacterium]|nr:radical SAM protein [Anaerolineae bacterium]
MRISIGKDGALRLPKRYREQWGLEAGTELLLERIEDGFALREIKPDARRAYIEVTTRCNLNCRICIRQVWRDAPGEMDWQTFEAVVEQLGAFPDLGRVIFGGFGEPLVHARILEMMRRASELGVALTLTTNGLLLDEALAKALLETRLDKVVVSLDTVHAQAYSGARPEGGLERVMDNVRTLMALAERRPWPPLNLVLEFVATRSNQDELTRLREVARDLGASSVLVTNLLPHTQDATEEILYDSDQPVALPLSWPVPDRGAIVWGRMDLPRTKWGGEPRCRFVANRSLVVGWDGGVSPCYPLMHSYPYYIYGRLKNVTRYVLGNVRAQPLLGIWTADEYVAFRAKVREFRFPSCVDCGLDCPYTQENEDCLGNVPSCADCLWAQDIIRCP